MHRIHSSHRHAEPHSHAVTTTGHTIHWARYYDLTVNLLTLGQGKKLRVWTIETAHIQTGESVLDVGCGTGDLTLAAKRAVGSSGRVFGIDASPEMIAVAQDKTAREKLEIEYRLEPIERLSFADNSMDVVLSSLMMHHLPDELKRAGLDEIYRVLKPGGRILILDFRRPVGQWEHMLAHVMFHSGMRHGVQDYPALLQAAGFVNAGFVNGSLPLLGAASAEKADKSNL